MPGKGPAIIAVQNAIDTSILPPSVNGSAILYFLALTAMMCLTALGGAILIWMMRETWRERNSVKRNTVLFNFRLMMGLVGLGVFLRAFPEVLYLQMYGDPKVSLEVQAAVTTVKRIFDSVSLFAVISWAGLLVMIYPFVCKALEVEHEGDIISHLTVDDYPSVRRLARPFICFILIAIVAMAFSFSKVYHP